MDLLISSTLRAVEDICHSGNDGDSLCGVLFGFGITVVLTVQDGHGIDGYREEKGHTISGGA